MRCRFGISAPRVAVGTRVPWYWVVVAAAILVLVSSLSAWVLLRTATGAVDETEAITALRQLRARVVALDEENRRLRETVAGGERQIQIEAATHESVARQGRATAAENTSLREDLAFFQSMAPHPGDGGVTVNRFEMEPGLLDGDQRFRLLVVQPRKRGHDFKGRLQLAVEVEQDGVRKTLSVPPPSEDPAQLSLEFRFFQRVEGGFRIPPGATVRRVEVLVMEQGFSSTRSSRTFNF